MTATRPIVGLLCPLRASYCLDPHPVTRPTTREWKEADVEHVVCPQWGGFASIPRLSISRPKRGERRPRHETKLYEAWNPGHAPRKLRVYLRNRSSTNG